MKCYCTASGSDCPADRQKECAPGVQHCFLTLKWNESSNNYVKTIQDCWQWTDKHKCPEQSGLCHILQESEKGTKTCCCKGNLCNNATDVQLVLPNNRDSVLLMDSEYTDDRSSQSYPEQHSVVSSDTGKLLSFVLPIACFTLVIVCSAILVQLCRSRFKTLNLKQTFRRSHTRCCNLCRSQKPIHTGASLNCACEHLGDISNEMGHLNRFGELLKLSAVGEGCLSENEFEGLASMITKVELKSQGCFGQVWHGRLSPDLSGKTVGVTDVAVKIFRLAQKESWDSEVALFRLPGLTHPNILKYYGADQVTNNFLEPPELEFWIVTEYHPLGSLYDYLKQNTVSWSELLHIAVGIARGLSHLHSEGVEFNHVGSVSKRVKPSIAHRDLNSRNVVLKADLTACIADFGLAIRFEPGQFPSVAHPQLGTRRYMAPEVLDGAIQFSRDAYLRIDVYAMGLVFWELMSRCHGTYDCRLDVSSPYRAPFELELGPTPTIADLERYVTQEKQRPKFSSVWADCPSMCSFWETVEECWDQDAEARLSAGCVTERLSSLLRQPWSGLVSYKKAIQAQQRADHHTQPLFTTETSPRHFNSGTSAPLPNRPAPLTGLTHRPLQPIPISFPVPSTSLPAASQHDEFPQSAMLPHVMINTVSSESEALLPLSYDSL